MAEVTGASLLADIGAGGPEPAQAATAPASKGPGPHRTILGLPRPAESGVKTAEDVTRVVTADLPPSLAAVVRAAQNEIGEPIQRLLPGAITGLEQPSNVLQSATDVAQLAGMAAKGGPAATALMIGTQAAIENLTGNPNMARTLAALGQTFGDVTSFVRSVREARRAGKSIIQEADVLRKTRAAQPGRPRLTPQEATGAHVQNRLRRALGARKKDAQRILDTIEGSIVTNYPTLRPGTPEYLALEQTMNEAPTAGKLSGVAGDVFSHIDEQLRTGAPVSTHDVLELRQLAANKVNFQLDRLNPDASMLSKQMSNFREGLADSLERAAPPLAKGYRQARTNYRVQYTNPARAARSLIDNKVTPAKAYSRIFGSGDQAAYRTILPEVRSNPIIRGKLRQGFVESLADETGKIDKEAIGRFTNRKAAMAASGLFEPNELMALENLLKSKELPGMLDTLSAMVPGGARRGQVLPSVIGIGGVSVFGPATMLGILVGSGSVLELRKLSRLGQTRAGRAVAVRIAGKVDDYAKGLSGMHDSDVHGPMEGFDEGE